MLGFDAVVFYTRRLQPQDFVARANMTLKAPRIRTSFVDRRAKRRLGNCCSARMAGETEPVLASVVPRGLASLQKSLEEVECPAKKVVLEVEATHDFLENIVYVIWNWCACVAGSLLTLAQF